MKYQEGMLVQNALKDQVIMISGGGTGLGAAMGRYFYPLALNW